MTDKIDVNYLDAVREKGTTKLKGPYVPGTLLEHPKTVTRRGLFWTAWLAFWGLVSMWAFATVRF